MIPSWLGSPEWTNVVGALLHTLWQGTLIAVLLGLVLRRLTNPVVRYRYALGALVGVIAAGLVTWGILCRPLPAPTPPAPPNLFVAAAPAAVTANDSAPLIVQVQPLAPKAPNVRWTAWLALLWVVGTMLMLGRAAFQVAGAERLRRSSRPLEDPHIVALLAEAREAVGLMRRVRLAVTDQLTSPVVAGVLVPTLILPFSLVSSIAPEQIRFILLHELAHIRRGDYFANLFQLFAEALLFFNPAVWWISRQMRLEREACCDALAVELSGAPADYARTLVRVVENALSPAPAAAPALGDRREPSSLADRLQRMLVPGYRPALRLTWRAMFAALLMGGVLLFLSALGTRVTIAAIPGPTPAAEVQPAHGPAVLIQAEIYQASPENLQTLVPGLAFHAGQTEADSWWLASPAQFAQLQKGVKKAGLKTITRPRIQTWSGEPAQFFVGNDDGGTELDCQPTVIDGQVQLDIGAKISDRRASSAGTNSFAAEALLENHGGMVFNLPPLGGGASNFMVMVEVQIVTNGPSAHSNERAGIVGDTNFQATLDALKQRTGVETLGEPEITTVAGRGENRLDFPPTWIDLTNRVGNSGLENSNYGEVLHARTFFLNPAAVGAYLETPEGARTNNVGVKIKEFLSQRGVDWKYGKAISYNETYPNQPGILWVKATDSDLYIIETALLKEHWSENFTNFEAALRAMESAGVTNLVEPEGTTITPRSENPSGIFPGQQPTEVDPTNGIGNGGSAPSPGTSTTETAKTITFKLEHPAGQAALKQSLEQAGVQFPATALFYTDGGAFLARGTAEQLALINGVVRQLNGFPTDHPDATAEQFIASLQHSTGAQTTNANHLYIRTFKVEQSLFLPALQQAMKENLPDSGSSASPSADPSQIIRDFFQSLGLDLSASSGESVSYNPQRGLLYVNVTDSDFDTIGRALQLLNTSEPGLNSTLLAPQIHIAARFIEVPVGTMSGFASFTGGQLTGILTDKNARVVLKALKARDGTEVLAEPEIVMLSGHRAQMRATEIINAVTNIVADANGKVIVQTGAFETGPALDVIPHVLADGYTINLEVIPTLTVFEGYADQGQTATNSGLPLHPPVFQTQKLTADVNLWDNQTLVLGGMEDRKTTTLTPTFANMPLSGRLFETKTNEVLILVTATMVDATGSRVHTDAEMPFAQSSVPTQPPSTNNGVFTSYAQPAPTSIKTNTASQAGASTLVQDGEFLYENNKFDQAKAKFNAALELDPDNASAKHYLGLIDTVRSIIDPASNANRTFPPIEPNPTNSAGNTTPTDLPGQQTMTFRLNDPKPEATVRQLLFDAGVQMPPTTFLCVENGFLVVHGTPEQLALVNGVVLKLNGHPAQDVTADHDRFVQQLAAKPDESTNLLMRTFKVDTNRFQAFLEKNGGSETNIVKTFRNLLNQLGLNFDPNTGKALFYKDRLGYLFVKATDSDLDTVERVLQAIHQTTPEIHIKARFIEVPAGTGLPSFAAGQLTGILTDTNTKTILQALTSRTDTESLGEPEVTMLSGRQVQMRATDLITVVTNMTPGPNGSMLPQTGTVEVGPVLDVAPHVLEDGYTINLEVTPSLTEFDGYDQSGTNSPLINGVSVPAPIIQTQVLHTRANIWDGQTVVLGGMTGRSLQNQVLSGSSTVPAQGKSGLFGSLFKSRPKTVDREVLILITASIVDSTGARVHTDEEMPFAQNHVPIQPPTTNNGVFTSYGQPAPTFIKANVSREAEASALVEDGKLLYEMGKLDEAEAKFKTAFALNPDNASAKYYLALISVAHTESERTHDDTNQTSQPRSKAAPANDVIYTGPGRQKIVAKLNSIHLDSVSWDGLPLSEVLRQLSVQCKALDPEHKGVNFLINNNRAFAGWPPYVSEGDPGVPPGTPIDPATGPPLDASSAGHKTDPTTGLPWATEQPDAGSYIIKIPSLTDIRLADALDAIVMVSDHPLKYSIQDFAIVFSPRSAASPQLFTQTFLVDPNTFDSGLEGVGSKSFGVNHNNNGGSVPVVGVVNSFSGEGAVRSSGNSGVGGSGGGGGGSSGDATPQSVGSQEGGALYNSTAEMAKLDLFMTEHHPWDNPTGGPTNNPATNFLHRAIAYFTTLGINFQSPPGKAVFYNDRTGVLFVKATKEDLEIIKRAIQNKNNGAPVDRQILGP